MIKTEMSHLFTYLLLTCSMVLVSIPERIEASLLYVTESTPKI